MVTALFLCLLAAALFEIYWFGITITRATTKIIRFWLNFVKRGNSKYCGILYLGLPGVVAIDAGVLLLARFLCGAASTLCAIIGIL
jgi:hypothetical protein